MASWICVSIGSGHGLLTAGHQNIAKYLTISTYQYENQKHILLHWEVVVLCFKYRLYRWRASVSAALTKSYTCYFAKCLWISVILNRVFDRMTPFKMADEILRNLATQCRLHKTGNSVFKMYIIVKISGFFLSVAYTYRPTVALSVLSPDTCM